MKRSDTAYLIVLAVLALFIWLRDTAWISTADDTLPILIALPIFVWLGWPWKFRPDPQPLSTPLLVLSVILFLSGIALDLCILLTLGWVVLLWTWISSRIVPEKKPYVQKLLILPIMAFPWISLDFTQLGWWFRLTGAYSTAQFFSLFGAEVEQMGTNLKINQLPISVEAACAGLNTLQSMLIAGSIIAFISLGKTSRFWWSIPILFIMAWFANTIRIIVLSIAALAISPEFALGAFHTWGGWFILILMFLLCWGIFYLMEPKRESS